MAGMTSDPCGFDGVFGNFHYVCETSFPRCDHLDIVTGSIACCVHHGFARCARYTRINLPFGVVSDIRTVPPMHNGTYLCIEQCDVVSVRTNQS